MIVRQYLWNSFWKGSIFSGCVVALCDLNFFLSFDVGDRLTSSSLRAEDAMVWGEILEEQTSIKC